MSYTNENSDRVGFFADKVNEYGRERFAKDYSKHFAIFCTHNYQIPCFIAIADNEIDIVEAVKAHIDYFGGHHAEFIYVVPEPATHYADEETGIEMVGLTQEIMDDHPNLYRPLPVGENLER